MEKIIDENKQGESLIIDAKEGNTRKLFIESYVIFVYEVFAVHEARLAPAFVASGLICAVLLYSPS